VTAVLRELLANGLIRYSAVTGLDDVSVTVLPPDRISVAADEPSQLNLFMYRIAPHPSLARRGSDRVSGDGRPDRSRLALDLHYLLTAYSSEEYHAEILLGCAIQLLATVPVLTRELAGEMLRPPSQAPANSGSRVRTALSSAGVVAALGRLRVTQQSIGFEEMSKLWSAFQARLRPSVGYEVSSVTLSSEG
jgi:hypothetical protein